MFIVVGCYTDTDSTAIEVFELDRERGELAPVSRFDGIEQASFVVAHPNGRVIYAASEYGDRDGEIHALDHCDGGLELVESTPSGGRQPCYLSLGPRAKTIACGNYGSGTILLRSLDGDGGFKGWSALQQHRGRGPSERQQGPHVHCVVPGRGSETFYAVDLGIDRVVEYRLGGEELVLVGDVAMPPGSGPRHLVVHPDQPLAFVVGELDCTISLLRIDDDGGLSLLATASTLPAGSTAESLAADIRVHPNGRYVYASNRGDDTIALFRLTAETSLELVGHIPSGGRGPRGIGIDPSGQWLLVANQHSDNLVLYSLDKETGYPTMVQTIEGAGQPVSIAFVERNR